MKPTNFFYFITFLILVSCKNQPIIFSESQPRSEKQLYEIPRRLFGEYFCVMDSTILNINRSQIKKTFVITDTIPNKVIIDTLFDLKRGDILKKYKGYYFLNNNLNVDEWLVSTLKLKNGILTVGNISSEEEISKMENITETRRDTEVKYKAAPTKKQLKQFLNEDGFNDQIIYIKQNR